MKRALTGDEATSLRARSRARDPEELEAPVPDATGDELAAWLNTPAS